MWSNSNINSIIKSSKPSVLFSAEAASLTVIADIVKIDLRSTNEVLLIVPTSFDIDQSEFCTELISKSEVEILNLDKSRILIFCEFILDGIFSLDGYEDQKKFFDPIKDSLRHYNSQINSQRWAKRTKYLH